MKEIKWVTPCHHAAVVIGNQKWTQLKVRWQCPHIWINTNGHSGAWYCLWPVLRQMFMSPVSVSQIQTALVQAAALSRAGGCGFLSRLLLRDPSPECSIGQQRQRFDLLFISIVIQNYCQRIKDRFGKNLPGLIWMLFGGIIFFQLRVQDMERFYFWPEIPVYERSYF